jgi:hypothetical protein
MEGFKLGGKVYIYNNWELNSCEELSPSGSILSPQTKAPCPPEIAWAPAISVWVTTVWAAIWFAAHARGQPCPVWTTIWFVAHTHVASHAQWDATMSTGHAQYGPQFGLRPMRVWPATPSGTPQCPHARRATPSMGPNLVCGLRVWLATRVDIAASHWAWWPRV